jgi:hypothetical protein
MGVPPWLNDDIEYKVVLKQSVLYGSNQPDILQTVAIVYINGREYRVYAPPEAKGDAIDWLPHFTVRDNSEAEVRDVFSILAFKAVREELEKQKQDASRAQGMHPDGLHCEAQICLKGHVQHCDGMPFDSKDHCTICGSECIDECPHCNEPIRGAEKFRSANYSRPEYCHGCGRPYPWMADRLQTARELLRHDEELTISDRDELFDILKEVMSDPKSPLTPAKKRLIEIRLGKATQYVRELILDLIAKTAAESLKG